MNKTKLRLIEEVCFTEASFKSRKQFKTLVLVYGNDVKKMRSHQLKHWMWRRKTSIGRNADSLHEKVCATFKRRESFEWFIFKFSFLFFFFFTKLNIHKINKKNFNLFFCLKTTSLLYMSRFLFTLLLLHRFSNKLQISNINPWLYNIYLVETIIQQLFCFIQCAISGSILNLHFLPRCVIAWW